MKSEQKFVIKLDRLTFEGGYARLRSDPGWEMGGGGVSDKEKEVGGRRPSRVVLKVFRLRNCIKLLTDFDRFIKMIWLYLKDYQIAECRSMLLLCILLQQ